MALFDPGLGRNNYFGIVFWQSFEKRAKQESDGNLLICG